MNVDQQHIIKTIRYDIVLDNESMAFEVQKAISVLQTDAVNVLLENVLNSYEKEDVLHQFDTVILDLGILNVSSYQEELPSKIEEALRRFLAESSTENNAPKVMSKVQTSDADIQRLEHFLTHGYLPWNTNSTQTPSSILSNILLTNSDSLRMLLSRLSQNESVHKRLVYQFSEDILQRMLIQLGGKAEFANVEETNDVKETITAVKNEFALYNTKKKMVTDLLMSLASTETFVEENHNEKLDTKMERQFLNPVYVNHAGLVIVAPYLGMLFSKLELTENNEFVNTASQQRAVQLLGYVATGSEKNPEHELLISKMLCGMLAAEPLVFTQPLTEADVKMADEMLGALIQHWTAIQDTSIQGFRESFIMRNGKLEDDEDAFYLKVEQKAFDMLLDKIPWNISKIKLSWMQKALEVTWR